MSDPTDDILYIGSIVISQEVLIEQPAVSTIGFDNYFKTIKLQEMPGLLQGTDLTVSRNLYNVFRIHSNGIGIDANEYINQLVFDSPNLTFFDSLNLSGSSGFRTLAVDAAGGVFGDNVQERLAKEEFFDFAAQSIAIIESQNPSYQFPTPDSPKFPNIYFYGKDVTNEFKDYMTEKNQAAQLSQEEAVAEVIEEGRLDEIEFCWSEGVRDLYPENGYIFCPIEQVPNNWSKSR